MFVGKLIKSLSLIVLFSFSSLLITSCMKDEKPRAKSMEEIHADEGTPVTVKTIENTSFNKRLSFYARLSGIKESSQGTNFAERIKKINARVGQHVKAGQVIVEFPSDIPTLQFDQAKLALDNAEKTYNRMKALFESGETSQQNYDQAKMGYDVSKKNLEALNKMINIESPLDGTLIKLDVEVGEIPAAANPGMPRPLFTVAQLNIIKAKIQVNESEINLLKLGMPAKIHYNGEDFKGKISMISPALNSRSQAFEVEIDFPNTSGKLKSGVTADLRIDIYANPEALVIPRNLITTMDNKQYIFIERNGYAQQTEITTGMEDGINIEVTDGLAPGDNLINCCKSQLEDGMKVNIKMLK